MNDPEEILFESERLMYRNFIPDDAYFLFTMNNDPEVIKYTGNAAFKSPAEAAEFIANYDQYKLYGYGRWTVLTRDDMKPIGWCGLKYLADTKEIDLGYRFLKSEWNKGYATESALAAINYARYNLGLKKLIGRAVSENKASIRVLEKVGMEFVKTTNFDGTDGVIYDLML